LWATKTSQQLARGIVANAVSHAQAQPGAQLVFVHGPLLWNLKKYFQNGRRLGAVPRLENLSSAQIS
jgi:hypothetical protein